MELPERLRHSGITIIDDVKDNFSDLRTLSTWMKHPIWLTFATKLDETDVMFFLPDMYHALVSLTGIQVDYIKAQTRNGTITMYLVGLYPYDQPIGPFWDKNLPDLTDTGHSINGSTLKMLKFAQALQDELDHGKRLSLWKSSFRANYEYLTVHRRYVREVGRILSIDMDDHDLTKTRLVQLALGYMWHWTETKHENDLQLDQLAIDVIKAGHLELETHHPEYKGGNIEIDKLFVDRIAVHLQKDPCDNAGGWELNLKFIPNDYITQWQIFKKYHKDKDLNKAVKFVLDS